MNSKKRAAPHREQIKAMIRMKGLSLSKLGARHGLCASAIRMALKRPSPQCEQIIAEFLGTQPQKLWPDRYDSKGRTKYRTRARKVAQ
ncbi:MAG TPA: helix-turn-helix domain-containing protein [Polyangiaceae bacterium]|nr:helix-turn-helix domain-containing protein [Polyangiaceae bacterium]